MASKTVLNYIYRERFHTKLMQYEIIYTSICFAACVMHLWTLCGSVCYTVRCLSVVFFANQVAHICANTLKYSICSYQTCVISYWFRPVKMVWKLYLVLSSIIFPITITIFAINVYIFLVYSNPEWVKQCRRIKNMLKQHIDIKFALSLSNEYILLFDFWFLLLFHFVPRRVVLPDFQAGRL